MGDCCSATISTDPWMARPEVRSQTPEVSETPMQLLSTTLTSLISDFRPPIFLWNVEN